MTRTLVSMSEIMRVGPWSLRALGHPFGVAERATRLLTWSQAALGHGLDLLRIGEAALTESNRRPAARRGGDAFSGRRIDAGGRNLFEIGPVAVDLATCDARLHGVGQVVVEGAIGAPLIPALADMAAGRGLDAAFVYRTTNDDIRIEGWPECGRLAVVRRPSGALFFAGAGAEAAFAPAFRDRALRFAAEARPGALGIFAAIADADRAAPVAESVDYSARVAHAYRRGVEVATEDLAHLYALERITWAPTSERSRKQAGY